MKKLIYLVLVLFTACAEPEINIYTDAQNKAITALTGRFVGYQLYSSITDTIVFEKYYDKPLEFYVEDYMKGRTLLFSAIGECSLKKYGYKKESCYFNIFSKADAISLYYKNWTKDVYLYEFYDLEIKSLTEFNLYHYDSVFPIKYTKR